MVNPELMKCIFVKFQEQKKDRSPLYITQNKLLKLV
jgi:hypothetical protein